jgi:hypothetical protein
VGSVVVPEPVAVGAVVVVEAVGFGKRPPPLKMLVPPVDAEEMPAAGCGVDDEVAVVEVSAGFGGNPNKPPVEVPLVVGAVEVSKYSVRLPWIKFVYIPVDVVVFPKTVRET